MKKKPKGAGKRAFMNVVILGVIVGTIMLFFFVVQAPMQHVKLINLIMTLGGFETYADTVIGFSIILLLFGMAAIAFRKEK